MKAIYTYYNFGKDQMNFSSYSNFIDIGKKSIDSAKQKFSNVTIYTNDLSISDIFDDVNVEKVDFGTFRPVFWNYPKLVSYSLQDSPFVHIDFDFILKDELSTEQLQSDIICENVRGRTILRNNIKFLSDEIAYSTPHIICSGFLGGNNTDVFKELKLNADTIVNDYDLLVSFDTLVGIEEIYLTYLIKKYNLSLKQLTKDQYIHYQNTMFK
jgi:hypothetical protein